MTATVMNQATVLIDGAAYKYKANSITFKTGTGEATSRAQQSGGGKVEVVSAVNGETMMGYVKFDMLNTIENSNLVDTLSINKIQGVKSVIQIVYAEKNYTFQNAILKNDVEQQDSNDGSLTLEFDSDPAITI